MRWERLTAAGSAPLAILLLLLAAIPVDAQISHFEHIVVVVQENRTTDDLFQGLCGPQRTLCPNPYDLQNYGFNSKGQKVPLKQVALSDPTDPLHDNPQFVQWCDLDPQTQRCRLDGADKIECHITTGALTGNSIKPPWKVGPNCSYESVDPATIKPYIDMVHQYGYANYMFSTSQGGSFPGHQFLFGGTSAPSAAADQAGVYSDKNIPWAAPVGCGAYQTTYVVLITPTGGSKTFPCFEHKTIPDILPANVTWRYYIASNPKGMWTAPNAIKHICQPTQQYGGKCAGPEWVKNLDLNSTHDVLADIANCKLRNLSWIIPSGANSDHPGAKNANGPSWVTSIVNAIGTSTACDNHTGYWKNTAILVVWDDFGGFYDHVSPPILPLPQGDFQFGPRVPLLFISAYTPVNYIDNNQQDFGTMLRFMEQNWGIQEGVLNFADARSTNDLTTFFNLNMAPRVFVPIGAPKDASYFLNDKSKPDDPDDD